VKLKKHCKQTTKCYPPQSVEPKWFIPRWLVLENKKLSQNSFLGKHEVTEKKIVLYSRNGNCNYTFLNPIKSWNRLGYIAERKSCPKYFSDVIYPETPSGKE